MAMDMVMATKVKSRLVLKELCSLVSKTRIFWGIYR